MLKCPSCSSSVLELITFGTNGAEQRYCEPCYRAAVITPLQNMYKAALIAATDVKSRLTTALERLARTSHHNFDGPFTCNNCDKVYKTGLDLVTHLSEDACFDKPKPTKRQEFVKRISNEIVEEFGV